VVPLECKGNVTSGHFEVLTHGNPVNVVGAVRGAVESVDKDLPPIEVRTQQQQIDAAVAPERTFATVTSGFGILAILLAGMGVYGVIAAGVPRRINQIGVRMALGARAEQVSLMVMTEALGLAFARIGTGSCAALFRDCYGTPTRRQTALVGRRQT